MKRVPWANVIVLLTLLASTSLVACQQSAPAAAPTSAVVPPVSSSAATATSVPTVAPTPAPTVAPTATRAATAMATQRAATPAAVPSPAAQSPATEAFSEEMDQMMAAVLPTLMAIMPTAPPAPRGQSVTLSQSELNGRWDGYITFDSVKLTQGTPEQQKACDDQLAVIKGRQLPSGMEFDAKAPDSGTMTMINKEIDADGTTNETEGDTSPYTYRGGTLTISFSDSTSATTLEGKALRMDTGLAIVGTWKSTTSDLSAMGASVQDETPAVIEGTWTMLKSR